ncbi:putative F-box protein At1g47790 [Apium graveolens]|uniref:putative F-box protein At1g47790 n=1 Tax=Apium graveolens TaxID=4045 RepID=UPI003D7AFBD2
MAPIRHNPTLSDDLISEILVRVPVKSLLRFQSVCKSWLSLIKHSAFVRSQLLYSSTTQTDQTLIISRYRNDEENKFLLLRVDSREIEVDLKYPYSRDEFTHVPLCTLVGSANGIVCIAVDFINLKVGIYLWNPATRQSKAIPTFRDVHHESLGFGYDPIDDDYKVVRIVMPPSFSEVYSANTNVWRNVPDPIDRPLAADFDVCVNGFLCGIGEYGMMAFDLNKEVLNCGIKLPVFSAEASVDDNENDDDYYGEAEGDDNDDNDYGEGDHDNDYNDDDDYGDGDDGPGYYETRVTESNARIIEYSKSIAVLVLRDNGLNYNKRVKMWTLDDDACLCGGGVEASWTPVFSIDLGIPAYIVHGFFSNKDVQILLENVDVWISCNIDKKEAKIIPLSIDMAKELYNRHIYKYTESLVSLEGFGQVNWNADGDDN